jgi:hypothetical protein
VPAVQAERRRVVLARVRMLPGRHGEARQLAIASEVEEYIEARNALRRSHGRRHVLINSGVNRGRDMIDSRRGATGPAWTRGCGKIGSKL